MTLVVLEGIDSAGKRTQALMLMGSLKARFPERHVEVLEFPNYKTPVGQEIAAFLHKNHNAYPPEYAFLLFVANRWEMAHLLRRYSGSKDVLILNRYSESNLAYGLARGLDLDWLKSIEFGLPKSDLVVVIDVDPTVANDRNRKQEELVSNKEGSVQEAYLRLAQKFGWATVSGKGGVGDVHDKVMEKVLPVLEAT